MPMEPPYPRSPFKMRDGSVRAYFTHAQPGGLHKTDVCSAQTHIFGWEKLMFFGARI